MEGWSLRLDVIGQFKPTTTLIVCFKRLRSDHGVFSQGKARQDILEPGVDTPAGATRISIFFEESMRLTLLPTLRHPLRRPSFILVLTCDVGVALS